MGEEVGKGRASNLTPELRAIRSAAGKIGAHRRLATTNAHEVAAPARAGFLAKFEREVDPDGTLDPVERARRADHALKAHMAGLALKSAQSRKRRSN